MGEDESRSWHWADADGVESIVDEWELLSSLTMGTLPHYTLVWRTGWKEWLPACQVAELSSVLPKDKLEKPVTPKLDASMKDPPPAPVDRYQAYQTRSAAAKLLGKSKPPTRTPAPPPGTIPKRPVPPPPAQPRPAQPTLVENSTVHSTATLRPPGAVPPPPRPVPTPTPVADTPIPAMVPAPVSPMIQIIESGDAAPPSTDLPTNPRAAAKPLHAPLPSWTDDLDSELRALAPGRAVPQAKVPSEFVKSAEKRPPMVLLALGAGGAFVVMALIVGAIFGIRALSSSDTSASSTPATSGKSGSRSPLLPCKLGKPASRLSDRILPNVTPIAAAVPGDSKVAVGFAASDRLAAGITIDPATLANERPFERKTDHDVSGVVPLVSGGNLSFDIDLVGGPHTLPRTLDTKAKTVLGWTSSGLARRTGDGDPVTVWTASSDKATDPRVAPVPGGGFAVTARRGGQSGSIVIGLLDDKGARSSDLVDIASKPQVGTPSIAASDRGVLVAFAARPSDESYWSLQLATAAPAQVPRVSSQFATPPGGPGADAISPAVEGLSNGRWLLQWTEGATGRRQVRVQTLGFDLVPVGDPVTVSPEEANAGQGVVMVQGGKAVSLFLVKKGKTHELWGASLLCP